MEITKKSNGVILIVTSILYAVLVLLLFFEVRLNFSNVIAWVLAIAVGVLTIMQSGLMLKKYWENKNYREFSMLLVVWWASIFMVFFAILDLAGIDNHGISTIMFIVVPLMSISTIAATI